jgi:general secretion pathway protein G
MKIQMKSNTRKGFTLIELLVVILILAILAALIVPRLISRADDAKRAKAMTDIKELTNALESFRLDTDRYPDTEEGLQALRVRPSDVNVWNGPYISRLPPDPWGHDYVYEQLDDQEVLVMSYGADGTEGGDGNNADITNLDETDSGQ